MLVANAHMHWDPEYSDVKLVQTMMFLSEVKNIVDKASRSFKLSSGENNPIPLVLCADLNSLPDSGEHTSSNSEKNMKFKSASFLPTKTLNPCLLVNVSVWSSVLIEEGLIQL